MKHATITLKVQVTLDESMLDSASWRCLWEDVDDLVEKARGMGEVKALSVDGLPDHITLVRDRDAVLMAHLRAAQRDGGS